MSAARAGYDSGVFTMRSLADAPQAYREVALPVELAAADPTAVDVRVLFDAPDGFNRGFRFQSAGASVYDDEAASWAHYGGLVSGVRNGTVHVWAPSHAKYGNGAIINLGSGSGGLFDPSKNFIREVNYQKTHTAQVRVLADKLRSSDWDSGWVAFRSQSHYHAHEFWWHGLGATPGHCRQYVRAVDGPLAGAVYEGRGDGQRGDYYGMYGGTVYGYNNKNVKVLAPDAWRRDNGRMVHVGAGWGNEQNRVSSNNADIRIKCWRSTVQPDFETDWVDTQFFRYETAYREVRMDLPDRPVYVEVEVRDPSYNYVFPALHMEQSHERQYYTGGGVVYAYDKDVVRLWAPSRDMYRTSNSLSTPLRTSHGWGGERYTWGRSLGQVKVRAWLSHPLAVRDSSTVTVQVRNVEEPPRLDDTEVPVTEVVDGVLPVAPIATLQGTDGDTGASLQYSLVAGNDNGAFRVSGNQVFIANATFINYELQATYNLGIRVTDGVFSSIGIVRVHVLNDNDPIHIFPLTFDTPENQLQNAIIGPPVEVG